MTTQAFAKAITLAKKGDRNILKFVLMLFTILVGCVSVFVYESSKISNIVESFDKQFSGSFCVYYVYSHPCNTKDY